MTTTRSTDVPVRGPGSPAVLLRTLIGQALRRLRLRQGRTLREVADAAQVSMPYLSEIERARKEASSEVLAAVCRALGLRLSDLLEQVRNDLLELELEPARPAVVPTASASAEVSALGTVSGVASAAVDLLDQMTGSARIVPFDRPRRVRRVVRPYFDVRCQLADAA